MPTIELSWYAASVLALMAASGSAVLFYNLGRWVSSLPPKRRTKAVGRPTPHPKAVSKPTIRSVPESFRPYGLRSLDEPVLTPTPLPLQALEPEPPPLPHEYDPSAQENEK